VAAETERLLLLPWSDEYLQDWVAVCGDARAMHFITGGGRIERGDAEQLAKRATRMWEEHRRGPWAAVEKATGEWVGRIGLNLLEDWPGPDKWEVGFELRPEFWGRGFATEGAREAVRQGFQDADLERIISVTSPAHRASRRVMEKCGLAYQGEVRWRGTTVVWYAVDRAHYLEREASFVTTTTEEVPWRSTAT
jgi:RimJ/RimL family protein N-acetyltransferase